jgi:hypothetical protein
VLIFLTHVLNVPTKNGKNLIAAEAPNNQLMMQAFQARLKWLQILQAHLLMN